MKAKTNGYLARTIQYLCLLGILPALWCLFQSIRYQTPTAVAFGVTGSAMIIASFILFSLFEDYGEGCLANRWYKIMELPYDEFPQTTAERYFLRGEWALSKLEIRALETSTFFDRRDQAREALVARKKERDAYEKDGLKSELEQSASELSGLRNPRTAMKGRANYQKKLECMNFELLVYKKTFKKHEKDAASYWNEFLKWWDLFRDMNMLPINPITGKPWDEPNKFRLCCKKEAWRSAKAYNEIKDLASGAEPKKTKYHTGAGEI